MGAPCSARIVLIAAVLLPGPLVAPATLPAGGVAVTYVEPEGPAERAGLRVGDLLVGIGATVAAQELDAVSVTHALEAAAEGAPLRLRYVRGHEPYETTLLVEDRWVPAYDESAQVYREVGARPVLSVSGARMRIHAPAVECFDITLSPVEGRTATMQASAIETQDRPARCGRPRLSAYTLTGGVTARVVPGGVLRCSGPAKLLWSPGGLQIAAAPPHHLALGLVTRWRGWGGSFWDPESEMIYERKTRWSRERAWGFVIRDIRPVRSSAPGVPPFQEPPGRGARLVLPTSGPLKQARLIVGDLLLEANGRQVRDPADLQEIMDRSAPNQRFRLRYLRGNIPRETELVVDAAFIPSRPPQQARMENSAGPRVTRAGDRTKLHFGDARVVSFSSILHADVSAAADAIRETELSAQGNRPHQFIYDLSGEVEVSLGDILLKPDSAARIVWLVGGGRLELRLTAR